MLLVGAAWLGLAVAPAAAQGNGGTGYSVTFVARKCNSYNVIFANTSRDNLMQTLEDLGPNSPYSRDSNNFLDPLVNPDLEDMKPQLPPDCTPLVGWAFTMGEPGNESPLTGPWGSLTVVHSPIRSVYTENSAPELDENGGATGSTIDGAVTVELTQEELDIARSGPFNLRLISGLPNDPVMARTFNIGGDPDQPLYAFGALRCAADNQYGDNIEAIYFPDEVTHVFCYAYLVTPPPTAGTITIQKQVVGAPDGDDPVFQFGGTVSYGTGGFQLANGQSMSFPRAGGDTWTAIEDTTAANYRLRGISCSTAAGTSTFDTDISASTATVHLAAGDHVTCVFTNKYVPPPGGLTIRKVTLGGVGTFRYTVTSGRTRRRASATTTQPRVAVDATPSLLNLAPGSYVIRERAPASPDGRWRLVRVRCDGESRSTTRSFTVTIVSGQATVCTFVNRFIPRGSISIAKITEGGTGTASFEIAPVHDLGIRYFQEATTHTPGVAADATPKTPADATDHLRLGTYGIVEQPPLVDVSVGEWILTGVVCDGVDVPFDEGVALVTLTPTRPHAHCVFTDTFTPAPIPPEPPPGPPAPPIPPGPPEPGPEPAPDYQSADLVVAKQASAPVVTRGGLVDFRITVHNLGPDPAQEVELTDRPRGPANVVSIHTSKGSCQHAVPVHCQLGTIEVGATVTITVRMRVNTTASPFVNRAVAGSGTFDPNLANNVADARVDVTAPRPPRPPAVTG